MSKYRILSDKVVFGEVGQTVDSDVFGGCNIEAMVAAGLIAPGQSAKCPRNPKRKNRNSHGEIGSHECSDHGQWH